MIPRDRTHPQEKSFFLNLQACEGRKFSLGQFTYLMFNPFYHHEKCKIMLIGNSYMNIWVFPKIGVPPNHAF